MVVLEDCVSILRYPRHLRGLAGYGGIGVMGVVVCREGCGERKYLKEIFVREIARRRAATLYAASGKNF